MNKPMIITTIRHGPTQDNFKKIISGRIDTPLSDNGRCLTGKLIRIVKMSDYDVVFSSPLLRTLETAKILLGNKKCDLRTSALCLERNYGLMQGVLPEEIRRIEPPIIYANVGGVNHSLNPPLGESFEQLRLRADKFLKLLMGKTVYDLRKRNILVVSHGTFLQQLHGILTGKGVYHSLGVDVAPLEVNRFSLVGDGRWKHKLVFKPETGYKAW